MVELNSAIAFGLAFAGFAVSILALVCAVYAVGKVTGFEKTEYKVIPVSNPQATSGLEKIEKQIQEVLHSNAEDLRDLGVDPDDEFEKVV